MKIPRVDILGKARQLERRIARTVDAAVDEFAGKDAPAPLEIVHAIVERAEQQIQESGRGRRVFPFNHVVVHLVAGARDKEARARYAAMVEGPPTLAERIAGRVRSAGCAVDRLTTDVAFAAKPGAAWENPVFHVEFDRVAAAPAAKPTAAAPPASNPGITLVAAPKATRQRISTFTGGRIDIGRGVEVVDQRQRLVRTNNVAFTDEGADANTTISRRHAHIEYDAAAGVYRLFDDHSLHGTSIIRNGRTIRVPPSARGTRLQSGDEIAVGQARLSVTIGE